MHPDVWLANSRIKQIRVKKFPQQSKSSFIDLATKLFSTVNLSKAQLSQLIGLLSSSNKWPSGKQSPKSTKAVDAILRSPREDSTPEAIIAGISMLCEILPGVSVLDLCCGNGTFAQGLPAKIYYEGYDSDESAVLEGQAVFDSEGHQFYKVDLTSWVDKEPTVKYNFVFAHPPDNFVYSCFEPCLETQSPGPLNFHQALAELAVKSTTKGGILCFVSELKLSEEFYFWLSSSNSVLLDVQVNGLFLLLVRVGVKHKQLSRTLSFVSDDAEECFLSWCSEQPRIKVSVSSEDPRPIVLKTWDIEITDNTSESYKKCVTYLYKKKDCIGIRWASPESALDWASHQAFFANTEESWNKTMDRFNKRLLIEEYLQLRQNSNLNQMLNINFSYTVEEEQSLKAYLDRKQSYYKRTELSYPEKSVIENKYYTLGSGSVLQRRDETWNVIFSEPDFSNSRPPKLHIEQV